MSRVHGYTLNKSKVAHISEDSVEVWLVDQVWLLRKGRISGSDDGTPSFDDLELGPYAGRLGFVESNESFQGDRWTGERRYALVVQTDEAPHDGDTARVRKEGVTRDFKLIGGSIERKSPARRLWIAHLEPAETLER